MLRDAALDRVKKLNMHWLIVINIQQQSREISGNRIATIDLLIATLKRVPICPLPSSTAPAQIAMAMGGWTVGVAELGGSHTSLTRAVNRMYQQWCQR